ncbi:hypothetical protein ACQ4PT_023189 [Festuca glaucescens]
MAPHGDRKKGKGKGPDRPGKPELRANRKEFKRHHKKKVEKGDGIEEQEQQPAPHSAAFFNAADDGDFPGGGRSLLSRDEMADARTEAEAESDKEERMGKKKRNANVSLGMDGDGDDDLGTLHGGATPGKLPRFENHVTHKNISANMKLWGVVTEVNQKDIIVSLSGGMRGLVCTEEVSDIALHRNSKDNEDSLCAEVVHVGQQVPCMVLRVDDDKKEGKVNKRVWLSLRLSRIYKGLSLDAIQEGMVLTAQVKSVEDHGYILYFGVSTFSGFMPKADKETVKTESGQLIQCVVKAIDKPHSVIHLRTNEDLISKSIIKDLKGLSIDHLIPGITMSARVHSVLENGPEGRNRLSNCGQGNLDKPNVDIDSSVWLSTRLPWKCSLCDITASSQQNLVLHVQGKRHKATAKAYYASQPDGVKDEETERELNRDVVKRKRADSIALEELDNDVRFQVMPYVVRVWSFETHMCEQHYKSCHGIIVDARPNKIMIAVHASSIDPEDYDTIRICFHDSEVRTAKFLIKKTNMFRILEVEESDHHYRAVRLSNLKIGREDVSVFWNFGQPDLVARSCSIINPNTAAIMSSTDSKSIVKKSNYFFTFGCKDQIQWLLGAPVFNDNEKRGVFVGAVHGNHRSIQIDDDGSGSDLIYACHAISFIPKLLKKIKDKLEEAEEKKNELKVRSQKRGHGQQESGEPCGELQRSRDVHGGKRTEMNAAASQEKNVLKRK